ncbi:unnamed protein product [Leuciscus chuanchicus]
MEKRTYETLNIEYKDTIVEAVSVVKRLEEELREKIKLVTEAFHCVETLEMIALNTDSLFTLHFRRGTVRRHQRAAVSTVVFSHFFRSRFKTYTPFNRVRQQDTQMKTVFDYF